MNEQSPQNKLFASFPPKHEGKDVRYEIDAINDLWHFVVQIVTIREFYDNENKRIIW